MGRHSSPNQVHFYRSFMSWFGLWVLIAVVTGIAVWVFVGAVGGDDARRSIAAEPMVEETADPEPTVSGLRVADQPTPEPVETSEPPATRKPKRDKQEDVKLITEGVTIQVLNGTMNSGAAQAVADRLSGLGFSIVAVEESSRAYSETTVFWSTDASREAAEALAERMGWLAEPKPANLADTVSFHVVVGADET